MARPFFVVFLKSPGVLVCCCCAALSTVSIRSHLKTSAERTSPFRLSCHGNSAPCKKVAFRPDDQTVSRAQGSGDEAPREIARSGFRFRLHTAWLQSVHCSVCFQARLTGNHQYWRMDHPQRNSDKLSRESCDVRRIQKRDVCKSCGRIHQHMKRITNTMSSTQKRQTERRELRNRKNGNVAESECMCVWVSVSLCTTSLGDCVSEQ